MSGVGDADLRDFYDEDKKYYGLQVHTLTFLKVDENGDSIDGKQYEYTGDHSSFCEGIDDKYLIEVENDKDDLLAKKIDAQYYQENKK